MSVITKKSKDYILKNRNLDGINAAPVLFQEFNELVDSNNEIDGRVEDLEAGTFSGDITTSGDVYATGFIGTLQGDVNTSSLTIDTNTVTQLTSISTGVTVTKRSGVITTVSSTLAADSSASFVVTATGLVTTTSRVLLTVEYGGNGVPVCTLSTVATNSFTVKLYNAHPSAAFNNTLKIHYLIIL